MYVFNRLDNGIRVVMENITYVNSVSIGVIIGNGSIKEDKHINGISHFIEHMLFKGTKNRNAKEIAEAIDNIGGQLNAFTGKEYTCYYAQVLDNHLSIAIDVLGDMLNNSLFLEEDIEKEKGVVMEEVSMYLDSPEDLVYDLLNEIMFENTSLAYPILGTEETIDRFRKDVLLDYFYENYTPENIVISLVGNLDIKHTIKLLNQYFGSFNKERKKGSIKNKSNFRFIQNIKGLEKDIEQLNFCLGMEGVERGSDDMYPLLVMNNIFGGSMSSRLFQKIREDRGLAYSVYSHPSSYEDIGTFTIYAGLNSEQMVNVVKLIDEDIKYIKKNLISKDELIKSKEQLKGNYILGMEGTFSRMFEIGKSLLMLNKVQSPEEVLDQINRVTIEDVEKIVKQIFDKNKFNIAYVGDLENSEKVEKQIKDILFN
ncbi:insulinase family protein [Tissierella sp. MSJ-40]|uniref:Insulinase family protein n=1 Tax=Tissierella simiarum TaxID=2841534 RepID=A0ABS6E431_9FIRM|nr:pitrilysin family protein [Tissierella simiarum]MBU5437656.1 insulinase family protein [Tissierella simiarum]